MIAKPNPKAKSKPVGTPAQIRFKELGRQKSHLVKQATAFASTIAILRPALRDAQDEIERIDAEMTRLFRATKGRADA